MAFKLDVKISRQKSPGREGCLRQGEERSKCGGRGHGEKKWGAFARQVNWYGFVAR